CVVTTSSSAGRTARSSSPRGRSSSSTGSRRPAHTSIRRAPIKRGASSGASRRAAHMDQACGLIRSDPYAPIAGLYSDTVHVGVKDRQIHPRSIRQKDYVEAIRQKDMVFGVGPAGTGKTYLAMAMAVSALFRSEVRKIVLTRPAVEAGEKLGFLPGDLVEKVNPYLRPLHDALHDIIGYEKVGRMLERGIIEMQPIALLRVRRAHNT